MENFSTNVSIDLDACAESLRGEFIQTCSDRQRDLLPQSRNAHAVNDNLESLEFDYAPQGRRLVIVSIGLPDGGSLKRLTEPLPGKDGESGFRVLKGYSLPDGQLLAKDIRRNSDGSISLLPVDPENRLPHKPEIRMSQSDFIKFIKAQMRR